MYENATITLRDRKMTIAFDGPAIEDGDQFENWHERVKIVCTHNASAKRFEAHVSWCKAAQRNGFAVEQTAIFSDPYVMVAHELAGRFSAKKFEAFCARAKYVCSSLVADEGNVSVASELLRKASRWSTLVQN